MIYKAVLPNGSFQTQTVIKLPPGKVWNFPTHNSKKQQKNRAPENKKSAENNDIILISLETNVTLIRGIWISMNF